MNLRDAALRDARMLSPTVRSLTFEVDGPMPFTAGQWVSLRMPLPGAAEPLARSYSVASPPTGDGRFEVAVTRVENGPGSAFLHAMRVGDALKVTDPAGFFTLPEEITHPLLFIATGTGLAPIRSMVRDALSRGVTVPMRVLFGTRHDDGVLWADEWEALRARHPNLAFDVTLSRPSPAWAGRAGYVQSHLAEVVGSMPDCHAFVCGLSPMIKAVRATLKDTLGFTRQRIHTERYD
ncbi:MAG: FAD-dependent oxidoreductase [Polyangiales bacterium]